MTDLRKAAERLLDALDDGWVQRDDWVAFELRQALQRPVKSYTNGEPQYATQATGEPWLGSPDHCSLHPDAPHGYDRSASLNEHRYVCRCEGWIPNVSTKPQNVYTSEERVHESDKSIHEEIERLKAEIKRAHELAEYRLKLLMQMPEQEFILTEKDGSPCPEFWDWLPKAYNFEGLGEFTKYNMEVAFLAGKNTALAQPLVSLTEEERCTFVSLLKYKTVNEILNAIEDTLRERNT